MIAVMIKRYYGLIKQQHLYIFIMAIVIKDTHCKIVIMMPLMHDWQMETGLE